jgi:aminobenzoyl-glutamate utilization protein B
MSDGTTNRTRTQSFAIDYVERNAEAIAILGDSIFYFGELGMQEFQSAKLMCDTLEEGGFKVERGIAGFPTGFCATYGSGAPVIAMHTEYDANPDNSQAAGVASPKAITEGAPGHCEGHNVNAAVLVAGALAAARAIDRFGFKGTLKVFGAPAEEQLVSRPYYVRDGWFDDVDVAFHDHISDEFRAAHGVQQSALISATFTFHGETAHAGVAPWKGRDALDAVVLMDMGVAQYREHMMPTMNCQRVITDGGDQPNVIPRKAAVWWYFRASTAEVARKLFDQATKIAEGAALMTNTTVAVEVLSAVWPTRGNRTLAELVQRNAELIGTPDWSPDEEALARELQTSAGVRLQGLKREVPPLKDASSQKSSASDSGDVSWKVPQVKFYYPANIPNISNHHWTAGVALATSIAHKGAVAGAKVLALSVLDCLDHPELVKEAKASFAKELGGVSYRSLLPPEQKPPVSLNRAMMEKFRPAMTKHYVTAKPHFA